ncbi:hypothetical protein D3C73_1352900 [compost metagenome]
MDIDVTRKCRGQAISSGEVALITSLNAQLDEKNKTLINSISVLSHYTAHEFPVNYISAITSSSNRTRGSITLL